MKFELTFKDKTNFYTSDEFIGHKQSINSFFSYCLRELDTYLLKTNPDYKTPGNFIVKETYYSPQTKFFPCCKDGATFSVYLTQILNHAKINVCDTTYTIYDNNDIVWKYPGYTTRSRKTN